jgi:hypothetical protein
MPDIGISPAFLPDNNKAPQRITPCYLVKVLDRNKENKTDHIKYFIATKFNQADANYGSFTGFFTGAEEEQIIANYDALIAATEATSFVEVLFPKDKIYRIQSLIYRHKKTA